MEIIRPAPFIVGVGRSGTTLLRLMLDSHPEIAIPPETHFIPSLSCEHPCSRECFFQALTGSHTWPDFHIEKAEFREALEAIEPFSCTTGLRCFYRLYALRFGKQLWGDKTPPYSENMALIQGLLPEARFVHIIRDGRDVALSYRGLWFGPQCDIREQARFWAQRITRAREQATCLAHYLEVCFEVLVSSPTETLAAVARFLEVPFSQQMLTYHLRARDRIAEMEDRRAPDGSVVVDRERRVSIHNLTSHRPRTSRVGVWRAEMTAYEQREFEREAGPLLHSLGYETRFPEVWHA